MPFRPKPVPNSAHTDSNQVAGTSTADADDRKGKHVDQQKSKKRRGAGSPDDEQVHKGQQQPHVAKMPKKGGGKAGRKRK